MWYLSRWWTLEDMKDDFYTTNFNQQKSTSSSAAEMIQPVTKWSPTKDETCLDWLDGLSCGWPATPSTVVISCWTAPTPDWFSPSLGLPGTCWNHKKQLVLPERSLVVGCCWFYFDPTCWSLWMTSCVADVCRSLRWLDIGSLLRSLLVECIAHCTRIVIALRYLKSTQKNVHRWIDAA